jgi:hypothetical protein
MSFSRLLKKYSQPSFSHSAPTGAGGDHSSGDSKKPSQRRQASEPTPTIPRPWRKKKRSTTDSAQENPSRSSFVLPSTTNPEGSISEGKTYETPMPMPLPPTGSFPTNLAMETPPEATPAISPVPDNLAEAWDAVKGARNVSDMSPALDAVGAPSGSSFLFRYTLIL